MDKIKLGAALLIASALSVTDANAMVYYFVNGTTGSDSNTGLAGHPFKTITKGASAAAAGDAVVVAAGTYAENVVSKSSGTVTFPIHFVSNGARIVPPANSDSGFAWENDGDYVVIKGFEIDGTKYQGGTPWYIGVYNTGSGDVIQSNVIHHIGSTSCGSQGAGGIVTDHYNYGVNTDIIGNIVHDIGPATQCGTDQGIYVQTSGLVANNIVYHNSGWGITTWHDATNVTIANNTVFNNLYGGIDVGSGGYYWLTSADVDNFRVVNNIVYKNLYGINEYGDVGTHSFASHNNSYGNTYNWSLSKLSPDTALVAADPQFVNYVPTGGGDYRLRATSPNIDRGSADYAPARDFNWVIRPQLKGFDIGAYEYQTP